MQIWLVEEKIKTYNELVAQYDNDKGRLQTFITDLEQYQESLKNVKVEVVSKTIEKKIDKIEEEHFGNYFYIGLGIIFLYIDIFICS